MATGPLAATIMDYIPIANIPPFGMCMSPANPTVIAATAGGSWCANTNALYPSNTRPLDRGFPHRFN